MIRREERREESGRFLLIRQADHARLSGELARRIGQAPFAPLIASHRGEQAIRGIGLHDEGWSHSDDAPPLNARQSPRDVFESKSEQSVQVWSASADRAMVIDPYAGLLVCLHGLNLSVGVLQEVSHQFSRQNLAYTRDRFTLNKFQHNEIDRLLKLRSQLGLHTDLPLKYGLSDHGTNADEDLLSYHFRTLVAMDRLSLALCCTRPPFDTIELAQNPSGTLQRIRLSRAEPRLLRMDPWIFADRRITCAVDAKNLPAVAFADESALDAAYHAAPAERLEFVLEPSV